ncbi:MAG: 1,4-alpha-glucan branching protein GlgB [Candidatus Brocadiia bacterium]|jgi:1,4-alpha-glucan branching enzyme
MPPQGMTLLSDFDLHLFNEGRHYRLYEKLGAHPVKVAGVSGTYFAVWAPNANYVAVIGDFNGWNTGSHPLQARAQSGIWEGFIPGVGRGAVYKFHIGSHNRGYRVDKVDPFGLYSLPPPETGSVIWDLDYAWADGDWMAKRPQNNGLHAPMTIYEVHLGSWKRRPEEGHRSLTYLELADELPAYLQSMGFSHAEFMPIMEHPFYGSWGYQVVGYFAPTSRYGTPQELMTLIDRLHQHGIGVILDWVPSHFTTDVHGLAYFDGTHLYEHADVRQGLHPEWNSLLFNYGRNEVQSFLVSNALFWLEKYHADGLRVDAVASMLYLDYARTEGGWIPNAHGGRENLDAISFIRHLNEESYARHPDAEIIAEESTAWPLVTRPTYVGGLGFGLKWDMGWMHDTLRYMSKDPVYRKYQHNDLTFRLLYAFNENFVLPLSHDEVVHGKGSLLGKMSGDDWQKFANLRALYGYMYAQPGKKLIFMGGEFAQWREWHHDESLDWHLLQYAPHQGMSNWVRDLNQFYRNERSMYELEFTYDGFEWVDCNDADNSVISLIRKARTTSRVTLVVMNFTPMPHYNYRIGVPWGGIWREALNSDAKDYGGSGLGNAGSVEAEAIPQHGRPYSLSITLPPLAALYFTAG